MIIHLDLSSYLFVNLHKHVKAGKGCSSRAYFVMSACLVLCAFYCPLVLSCVVLSCVHPLGILEG